MKAGGIVLIVVAALLLAVAGVYGYFSVANSGAAGRLESRLGARGGAWIGAIVRRKAEKQRHIALGAGGGGVLVLVGGVILIRKGKTA